MKNNFPDLWRGSPLTSLHQEIDRLFENFFKPIEELPNMPLLRSYWDMEEAGDHYVFSFDLPGCKKEDIKLEIQNDNLVLSAQRESKKEETGKYQRSYGSFYHVLPLPRGVKPEQIETEYKDGVLHLAIPKGEERKAQQIKIGEGKSSFFQKLLGNKSEQQEQRTDKKKESAA